MNPLIQCKPTILPLFIAGVLACFAISPMAKAVVPPPDGGYPGFNTAEGEKALLRLTTGVGNTAAGWFSLWSNTDGSFNTGVGAGTLLFNIGDQTTGEGVNNTAIGAAALLGNTTGSDNTAVGTQALFFNTTGVQNTAVGTQALFSNTDGNLNTANGESALRSNTTGSENTANGWSVLSSNTTGDFNTANGGDALGNNTFGDRNTANGAFALKRNTSGSDNIALGFEAGRDLTFGDFNIDIGNRGVAGESSTIRIGTQGTQTSTYVAGIHGATATNGAAVFIAANGKLGTVTSSARFKDDINPMDKASESIHALKPVTFRYKNQIDANATRQFGLIAEEVEAINPDLVVRDKEGKPYSVRYEQVNAMLLNEFLKDHCKVQELEAAIAKQQRDFQATVTHQQKQIEALIKNLQKVSAQLEVTKVPRQLVNNDY